MLDWSDPQYLTNFYNLLYEWQKGKKYFETSQLIEAVQASPSNCFRKKTIGDDSQLFFLFNLLVPAYSLLTL